MGVAGSKGAKKRVDESTSNSREEKGSRFPGLSTLRYVITEKPKWKVFHKKEVVPIPAYNAQVKPMKGCHCGSDGPCKQRVTPKGVTIHYPQKKNKLAMLTARKRQPANRTIRTCRYPHPFTPYYC